MNFFTTATAVWTQLDVSPPDNVMTNYYASATENFHNDDCPSDPSKCIIQSSSGGGWSNVEVTAPPGNVQCWTRYVHGYEIKPDASVHAHVGKWLEGIATPGLCQLECQKDSTCAYWMLQDNESSTTPRGVCILKTLEMMEEAQRIRIDSIDAHIDIQWCSSELNINCFTDFYKCEPCGEDQIKRCIYDSMTHVAGPKYCYDIKDECSWDPDEPTYKPHPHPPTDSTQSGSTQSGSTQSGSTQSDSTQSDSTDGSHTTLRPGPIPPTTTTESPSTTGKHHSTTKGTTTEEDSTTGGGAGPSPAVIAGGVVGGAAVLGGVAAAVTVFHSGGGMVTNVATNVPTGDQTPINRETFVEVGADQFA